VLRRAARWRGSKKVNLVIDMTNIRTLCVVALAAALTAACNSSDGSSRNPVAPTPSNPQPSFNLEAELTFCVSETNRYRATLGLSGLTRSGALEAYAAAGAQEDGLAHAPHQHYRSTQGGGLLARAENEISAWPATSSVHVVIQQGLAMMWAEGPGGGHYETMRGPYTQLGCGVFVNGNEITVVQDFR
jgi:uncharacterized protein YkwD